MLRETARGGRRVAARWLVVGFYEVVAAAAEWVTERWAATLVRVRSGSTAPRRRKAVETSGPEREPGSPRVFFPFPQGAV
jgi:hypothetical protein